MNSGSIKFTGLVSFMFFVPACAVATLAGDCIKTRSWAEIHDYPLVAAAILLVELLSVWGLAHLKKVAKGQKPLTFDKLSSQIGDKNSRQHSNDRIIFLTSATMHVLGFVCGFWLAWTRYRP